MRKSLVGGLFLGFLALGVFFLRPADSQRLSASAPLPSQIPAKGASRPAPAVPGKKAPSSTLQDLARRLEERDPPLRDSDLQAFAQGLDSSGAQALAQTALDSQRTHSERFLAAYLLAQRPGDFSGELEILAAHADGLKDPAPHTMGELEKHTAQSIRIQALLGLDKLAPSTQELAFFQQLQRQPPDPLTGKMAHAGELSIALGKPMMDAYVTAKLEGGIHEKHR